MSGGIAAEFFSLSATTLSGKVLEFSQYQGKVSLEVDTFGLQNFEVFNRNKF